jgi:hypothetical protein
VCENGGDARGDEALSDPLPGLEFNRVATRRYFDSKRRAHTTMWMVRLAISPPNRYRNPDSPPP